MSELEKIKEQYRTLELEYLSLKAKYVELYNLTQEYVKAIGGIRKV